jgi:hypothetical protein
MGGNESAVPARVVGAGCRMGSCRTRTAADVGLGEDRQGPQPGQHRSDLLRCWPQRWGGCRTTRRPLRASRAGQAISHCAASR